MPIGYLGYLKLENQFLLTNTTGLNRQVNPLMSRAVWGAGWRNAAAVVAYADSQMHFEGAMNFELQGEPAIWNRIRDWLIENRAYSKDVLLSPDGIVVYNYLTDPADPRTGVWLSQANLTINNNSLVTVSATGMALRRREIDSNVNWKVGLKTNIGVPTKPMNPVPRNRNPILGWNCKAEIQWPNSPAFWSDPGNLLGMVLVQADLRINNNTQIIRGCTGNINPVAVLQGTINCEGSMNLWRDGPIPDPYGDSFNPGNFGADGASVIFRLGGAPALTCRVKHVLLTSEEHNLGGQNEPVTHNFGIAGIGDGIDPPFLMDQA